MKKCLHCNTTYLVLQDFCPTCGDGPQLTASFPSYAPELAREGGGFKESHFAELVELEAGHFWFRARNKLILWAIQKFCPEFRSFLEIGCGTGYVLSAIADRYPNAQLYGSEIFTAGLAFAVSRQPKVNFMQMDARKIPFFEEFDTIGAFDVIEHIKQDDQVLTQMHGSLKKNGIMLLTVPQHAWLWSAHDEYACHERRYSAKELHKKVKAAGFEVICSTSFVSSLLPAMMLSRLVQKKLFEVMLNAELALIRAGISFPLGGTRLIVARKT